MKYISTRGGAPIADFADVLLTGLAPDGGLYVPQSWPRWSKDEIADLAGRPYGPVAEQVIAPFVGDAIAKDRLSEMISEAYATFDHRAVTPLVQIDSNHFLLELFHGPTCAFKDVAMQLLARMMDDALARRDRRATIVGATSGDTGGAAIEAFRGRQAIDIFILFPKGRVSPVQQRQMTCVDEKNVHAVAIDGTFDDCQALVKAMFNHTTFRDAVHLSGVNSINWARIVAQIVYYFAAATALGAPHRPVSFTVPTGNFGDIFAGYAAKSMGLPIEKLVIATNINDILARTIDTGTYEVRGVQPTASPSMDIQISSNFERLLFDAHGRDGGLVKSLMDRLQQSGSFSIANGPLDEIRALFSAGTTYEAQTASTIDQLYRDNGYLADPHTAVGLSVAEHFINASTPMVTLATAHPAKFPDAVSAAVGIEPPAPPALARLMDRPERFSELANDLTAVEAFISARSGAVAQDA